MAYKIKPNLDLSIYFDNDYFVTGDILKGTLELNVENELNLKLREICVELTGFEEINFQKVNASKVFFSTKIYFQGPRIKPSAAVRGPAECDGFWNAVQGKTLFNFSFKLPQNAPSSFSLLNNNANVKYIVTGTIQYHQDNIYDSLYRSEEILVVENIDQESISSIPVRASTQKKMFLGRGNSIKLEGIATQSYFCSGKHANIEVHVTNETKHKIHGLKANLFRSIIIPGTVTKKDNKSIVNSISDINLKSSEFTFNSNEEKSVFIQIPIPENNISMKNTSLFIVQYYITLTLNHGMFSKNISVNLPISICHSKLYNYISNPLNKPEINKNVRSVVSPNVLTRKKTFFNNLRSLSRKASVLKNKALLSKLCISDSDEYNADRPKRRGSSRLSEVNFPSNYDTIKQQNDMHMKNKNNVEDIDYYYGNSNSNSNDYSNSYSTEINTVSNMNIGLSNKEYNSTMYNNSYYTEYDNKNETEQDINNPTSNSYTSYDDTNNSNSYIQNENINAYDQNKDDNDMDEDTSDSEITGTENAYNSDIDKFSKYFSNKKVFRSLSADNNDNKNNNNNINNNNNSINNITNNNINNSNSKINNSITYSNTYNYGNSYNRSNGFDSLSIKSNSSNNQTMKNISSGEIRSSNSYRNKSNKSIPIKPKISSSNLKKVASIEALNDEEDNTNIGYTNTNTNITQDYDNTVFRNISSPYVQPNETSFNNNSYQSNNSRILNTNRNNINISNDYGYNNSNDNINEEFYSENSALHQSSVLSNSYANKNLNRNGSYHSNSSFSHKKTDQENTSLSSITSPYTRYNHNNLSFEKNRSESHQRNNKSSPLYNTSHSTSFHKNYYNEVNMNNLNFTQNCSFNNSNSTIITNNNTNNNNNSFSNNSFSYQSPRSLPSSSPSPPFSKMHFNGNIGHSYSHSYGQSTPMTPTIKHNFSNSSMKSSQSVDGYLNGNNSRNNNHLLNSNKNNFNTNNSYMKQINSSPAPISIKTKSNTEKFNYGNQSPCKPSSYSTPPLLNPSSPYSVPTISTYIDQYQYQRRPSLKYR